MSKTKKLSLKPNEYKKIKKDLELYLVKQFHPGSLIMNTHILNVFLLHKQRFSFSSKKQKGRWSEEIDTPIESKIRGIINFFVEHPLLCEYIQNNTRAWVNQQNDFIISIMDSLFKDGFIDKHVKTNNRSIEKNALGFTPWNKVLSNSDDYTEYRMNIEAFLSSNDNYIFYAREFTQQTLNIYNEVEQTINETFNLETIMLENSGQAGNIHNYMFNKIKQCKFMIADLSGYKVCEECKDKICNHINNNVIYEIGLAHGLGKSVIIIVDSKKDLLTKNNSEDLPFDINSHTVIQYNMDNFKRSLEGVISTTLENI